MPAKCTQCTAFPISCTERLSVCCHRIRLVSKEHMPYKLHLIIIDLLMSLSRFFPFSFDDPDDECGVCCSTCRHAWIFVYLLQQKFQSRLRPRLWREETATAADKARNSQAMKLAIMAPSIRLQKELNSSQTPVHRAAFTPCLPTHPIASAAAAADTSAFASNCSVNTCRGVPQTKPNQTKHRSLDQSRIDLFCKHSSSDPYGNSFKT